MNIQQTDPSIDSVKLVVPPKFRRGILAKTGKTKESIQSGLEAYKYIAALLQVDNFAQHNILDYGCGVKSSQTILQYELPIKSYYGIDIDTQMIDYLKTNVQHPKCQYASVPFHNALYNKEGEAMTPDYVLPCGDTQYDLITLQSVFIHFNTHDLEACLRMLKKHLKPDGKIFFTCLLSHTQEEDFRNLNPDKPLQKVAFRESFALDVIKKAGYNIDVYKRRNAHPSFPEHIVCSHAG